VRRIERIASCSFPMIYSLLFLACAPFTPLYLPLPFSNRIGFQGVEAHKVKRAPSRVPAKILREFRRVRHRFARIVSLSDAFSEGDAVPQIRPSPLQQSFNPRPRFTAPRADVIHYSTRRCSCLCVLVADITFTRGHSNAYSHGHTRFHTHACTRYNVIPVAVSELETPPKWCANQGALSSSSCIMQLFPRFTIPFSPSFLSPHLYLSSSHLCQVDFFVATARFALFYGIALFMRLVTTNTIASFLKTSLCIPKGWSGKLSQSWC